MSWKIKQRVCGTVLEDHSRVKEQYSKYPIKNFDDWNVVNLPEKFDGIRIWREFETFSSAQKLYSGDWAFVFCKIFKINLNLRTYRVFFVDDLSKSEILMRMRTLPMFPEQNAPSSLFTGQESSIFNGYSLIDVIEYCYEKGVSERGCINNTLYKDAGFDLSLISQNTFEEKIKILDEHKNLLDSGICLKKFKSGVYMAQKTYTIYGIAMLYNGNSDDTIVAIKKSIYRSGPVLSGITMYQEFLVSDGLDLFMGPSKESISIGGHAVGIFGWGEENGVHYWQVQTYWHNFGALGVIKVKMGLGDLEKNAIELEINLPNNTSIPDKFVMVNNPKLSNLKPIRVDPNTFYTEKTMKLIKEKKIANSDGEFVIKIDYNLANLISQRDFFAAKVKKYYLKAKYIEVPIWTYVKYFFGFLLINYVLLKYIFKVSKK